MSGAGLSAGCGWVEADGVYEDVNGGKYMRFNLPLYVAILSWLTIYALVVLMALRVIPADFVSWFGFGFSLLVAGLASVILAARAKERNGGDLQKKDKYLFNDHGGKFLMHCREIVENNSRGRWECTEAVLAAVFSMCVMLDGSGEASAPEYVVSVRDEGGELEPVEFFHHDL